MIKRSIIYFMFLFMWVWNDSIVAKNVYAQERLGVQGKDLNGTLQMRGLNFDNLSGRRVGNMREGGFYISGNNTLSGKVQVCPEEIKDCPHKQDEGKKERKEVDRDKVESLEFPYFLNLKEMKAGQEVSGVYYKITPEKTTIVEMSNVDINRVICPVDIQSAVYSEEKGIMVSIEGRNLFVKFKIKKVGEKLEYSTTPVDLHVICNNKVYSIIAFPRKIPAVLVYLEDKELELKEFLKQTDKMSYEERLSFYIKNIYSGTPLVGAEVREVNKEYNLFKEIKIFEKVRYLYEAEGIIIRVFDVVNIGDKEYIDLAERIFLSKEITLFPLAISLDRLRLNKGEKALLVIIEKNIKQMEE